MVATQRRARVDMVADSSPQVLNLREEDPIVAVRLRLVVVGQRIKPRMGLRFRRDDVIGHANNRRRIDSAAQLRQNRRVGTQSASYGLTEDEKKMSFVIGVPLVSD